LFESGNDTVCNLLPDLALARHGLVMGLGMTTVEGNVRPSLLTKTGEVRSEDDNSVCTIRAGRINQSSIGIRGEGIYPVVERALVALGAGVDFARLVSAIDKDMRLAFALADGLFADDATHILAPVIVLLYK
jgi:hypothetical protein